MDMECQKWKVNRSRETSPNSILIGTASVLFCTEKKDMNATQHTLEVEIERGLGEDGEARAKLAS